MQTRDEKKAQTRKSLMDAALNLTGNGRNFASISLREVAKNAGVVPTSFYRHFTDMEELGLNIIDDLGLLLRKLMRQARQNEGYFDARARNSVE
ncbi:TetR family transcriptional regulator, partial [Oleiphilus sp. HI0079]|uniref:TetR family transcriptional regulator n=2 Tax=Oleiphilus TaxID=141450 RepID=UPI000ABF18A5